MPQSLLRSSSTSLFQQSTKTYHSINLPVFQAAMCRPTTMSAAASYYEYPPTPEMSHPEAATATAGAIGPRYPRQSLSSPLSPAVRFSETTNTRVIPGLWQLSDDETSSLYYTGSELLTIRSALQSSAKLLRRATKRGTTLEALTSHSDTSRGIEHLASRAKLQQVQTEKEHGVRAALAAQNDGASPQDIARITSAATRDAADRAAQRAKRDEEAAHGDSANDVAAQELSLLPDLFQMMNFMNTNNMHV